MVRLKLPEAMAEALAEAEAAVAVLLYEVQEDDGVGDYDSGQHQDSYQSR